MTPGRRYLLGMAVVAAAASALSLVLRPDARAGVRVALSIALLVQGPLGWWLVRSVGAERFMLVWAIGIAARFAAVAASALLVGSRLEIALAPTLVALVGVLMCFVLIEAMVIYPGRRGTEVR